jgi:hypothetical protein
VYQFRAGATLPAELRDITPALSRPDKAHREVTLREERCAFGAGTLRDQPIRYFEAPK